jgi:hypothetical protein
MSTSIVIQSFVMAISRTFCWDHASRQGAEDARVHVVRLDCAVHAVQHGLSSLCPRQHISESVDLRPGRRLREVGC